eukprot:720-Heterococcus_DN1.PRE.2
MSRAQRLQLAALLIVVPRSVTHTPHALYERARTHNAIHLYRNTPHKGFANSASEALCSENLNISMLRKLGNLSPPHTHIHTHTHFVQTSVTRPRKSGA